MLRCLKLLRFVVSELLLTRGGERGWECAADLPVTNAAVAEKIAAD
jgi:hypothetical protein